MIAARQRRQQRLLRLSAAAIVFAVIAAGWAQWRLREVDRQRRDALEAAVDAELLALRLSDSRKFMQLQSDEESWRESQRLYFAQYQASYPRVQFPGEVLDVQIAGNEAQVTVHSIVDGEQDPAVWYYRYTAEGWKHVASPIPDWAQPTPTPILAADPELGFILSYYPSDQAYAVRVGELIGAWWDFVCSMDRMAGCPGNAPLAEVQIIRRAQTSVHWADPAKSILVVPAVAGMAPNRGTQIAMAHALSERWVDLWLHGQAREEEWLRPELALWLASQIDPETAGSPVFTPFVEAFGDAAVIDLMSEVRAGITPGEALRETMIRHAPQDAEPSAYHLSYLLRAETALVSQYPEYPGARPWSAPIQAAFFEGPSSPETWAALGQQLFMLQYMEPRTVLIESLREYHGIVWAEVRFTSTMPGAEGSPMIAYIPFRYSDGVWVHPHTALRDWGESRIEQGDRIRVHYYELDEPHTAGLLAWLEEAYAIIARDFDLQNRPDVQLSIRTSNPAFNRPLTEGGRLVTAVPSPYRECCLPGYIADEYLRQVGALAILDGVVTRYSGEDVSLQNVREGFISWEAEPLGLSYRAAEQARINAFVMMPINPSLPPDSLIVTWETIEFAADPYGRQVRQVAVMALLDVVLEQEGAERIGVLLRNLHLATDLGAWLSAGVPVGIAPQEIEPAWRERFHARLAASGLTP